MPWWSWILIWLLLVLILLGMLVLGAVYLWRRAKGLLGEVGRAQEALTSAYGEGTAVRAPDSARGTVPVGWEAAFTDPAEVRALREADKDVRVERRRARRIASLYANGRPRRWDDVMDPPHEEIATPPSEPTR